MRLLPAERVLISIIAVLAAMDIVLISVKGVSIDWVGYISPIATGVALVLCGQYYRLSRGEDRIALALGASGLFILFTLVCSVFNYMLLPTHFPLIDPLLVRIDSLIGYSWPNAVSFVSQYPNIASTLYGVYFSSLPQLAFVVLLLGFCGKADALWHFLLTGVIGVGGSILFWIFFPSFGPSTLYVISPDVLGRINLGVSPDYGSELLRLGKDGPDYISPSNILGLIGFPSFHTVMACMSVVFLSKLRLVFPFALVLNLAMIPAILVHGGHHFSDLIGGIVMFLIAYSLARKLLERIGDASGADGKNLVAG